MPIKWYLDLILLIFVLEIIFVAENIFQEFQTIIDYSIGSLLDTDGLVSTLKYWHGVMQTSLKFLEFLTLKYFFYR